MTTETHTAILVKPAQRQLQDQAVINQFNALIAAVNSKSLRAAGWVIVAEMPDGKYYRQIPGSDEPGYLWTYEVPLQFIYARDDDRKPERFDIQNIARKTYNTAIQPNFGKWELVSIDGKPWELPAPGEQSGDVTSEVGYAEVNIPDDFMQQFGHLYGLDPHINRILRALKAGKASSWRNRFHCVLQGQPGCGKSDICQTIKRILGEDAVMEFDATATTAAGAIKELTERDILPRVLIVEEIEKADPNSLTFLLGVCDLRGEIRKTTARASIQRNTKLFVIATVNNVRLFDSLNAGALSSRFANKINFRRPTREMRAKILGREIAKVDGDIAWIDPTLDYCEKHAIDDPRVITSLCLCGAEGWLDGTYETILEATAPQTNDEDVTDFN